MSSKRNNPIREGQEDAIEDANDTSKRLIPRQSKGIEDNPKINSNKRKDKVKKEQKIDKNESDEDKPFIDFIASAQKTVEPKIDAAIKERKRNFEESSDIHTLKAKVESGVVSILGGEKKGNAPKGKTRKLGHVFPQNLTEIEIGTGGPSTWDTNPVENKPRIPEANANAPSQNVYPFSSSRWSYGCKLTALGRIYGSGRPHLQEDDSPELSRVKDHFQTVDKFHSSSGNNGNSFLKTSDYARGAMRLSSGLPNSPQHFCFAKEEGKEFNI